MGLGRSIRRLMKQALESKGYSIARVDELTRLANKFGSDKGTEHQAHYYTRIYGSLFSHLRNEPITLLEIGLLRTDEDGRRGPNAQEGESALRAMRAPSLEIWRIYFPNARIFGFDIDDFSAVKISHCSIVRGDMSSRADLISLAEQIESPIDVVIDDGSHVSRHQQIALATLFPYVSPGGIYIIEDLHWQDPSLEEEGAVTTGSLFRQLQSNGEFDSRYLTAVERRFIEQHAGIVSLYDSLATADATDALGVLFKKTEPDFPSTA